MPGQKEIDLAHPSKNYRSKLWSFSTFVCQIHEKMALCLPNIRILSVVDSMVLYLLFDTFLYYTMSTKNSVFSVRLMD